MVVRLYLVLLRRGAHLIATLIGTHILLISQSVAPTRALSPTFALQRQRCRRLNHRLGISLCRVSVISNPSDRNSLHLTSKGMLWTWYFIASLTPVLEAVGRLLLMTTLRAAPLPGHLVLTFLQALDLVSGDFHEVVQHHQLALCIPLTKELLYGDGRSIVVHLRLKVRPLRTS